jgi:molybdenum cofactor guanylyltransferase
MEPTFTAVLLAGGQSTRMGRDKAYLPVKWKGTTMPLWERQLAVLNSLPLESLVVSGPRKQEYPNFIEVLSDDWNRAGPLAGIATCLKRVRSHFCLVLAIDLPKVQPGFLRKLLGRVKSGQGVVPVRDNRFEPLMAVYPAAALEVAIKQLQERDYVLQHFIAKLLEAGLMSRYEIDLSDEDQLENWNRPEDVAPNSNIDR